MIGFDGGVIDGGLFVALHVVAVVALLRGFGGPTEKSVLLLLVSPLICRLVSTNPETAPSVRV